MKITRRGIMATIGAAIALPFTPRPAPDVRVLDGALFGTTGEVLALYGHHNYPILVTRVAAIDAKSVRAFMGRPDVRAAIKRGAA